jgi:hypothetical protein
VEPAHPAAGRLLCTPYTSALLSEAVVSKPLRPGSSVPGAGRSLRWHLGRLGEFDSLPGGTVTGIDRPAEPPGRCDLTMGAADPAPPQGAGEVPPRGLDGCDPSLNVAQDSAKTEIRHHPERGPPLGSADFGSTLAPPGHGSLCAPTPRAAGFSRALPARRASPTANLATAGVQRRRPAGRILRAGEVPSQARPRSLGQDRCLAALPTGTAQVAC